MSVVLQIYAAAVQVTIVIHQAYLHTSLMPPMRGFEDLILLPNLNVQKAQNYVWYLHGFGIFNN